LDGRPRSGEHAGGRGGLICVSIASGFEAHEHAQFLEIMRYRFPSREVPADEAAARVEALVRENPLSVPVRAAAISYFASCGDDEARDRILARSLALFPSNDVFLNLALVHWGPEMAPEERSALEGRVLGRSWSGWGWVLGAWSVVLDWARGVWRWAF
jgi:hypothetical protein